MSTARPAALWTAGPTLGPEDTSIPTDKARIGFDREAIGRYVESRRSPEGGYCFYRTPAWGVEEPNAPDTLAALECLRLLGVEIPEPEATVRFLRALQDGEGGYPTLTIGWAALRALDVLGSGPARPAQAWLGRWRRTLFAAGASRQWNGALRDALHLLEVLRRWGPGIDESERTGLGELLDLSRDPVGGWARPGPDLETTGVATRLVLVGGLSGDRLGGAAEMFHRCEDPVLGLRLGPAAAATSAGALWGGLVVARALGLHPRHPEAVARSVGLLQRADGGLGARHRAISTLTDTWRGLDAAALLEQMLLDHPQEDPR